MVAFLAVVNGKRAIDKTVQNQNFKEYMEKIELANEGNYSALLELKNRTVKK